MRFVRLAALAFALLGLGMGPVRAAEPYRLRIGWVVASGDLATLMFAKPGLALHAGKTYIPELIHFEGTSTSMQALATGAVDTGALAYSTFALGVINAGMDDLQVISDGFQDGVPGYHTNGYFVRNDDGIKTVEDLKGKIIATNQRGSAVDMAVRAMLAKHDMQGKRDVTIIEVRFPDQKAMLKEKKVDLVTPPLPFGDLRALHYLSDPANHAETVALIAQVTKQKPSLFEAWAFTKDDYYHDPAALADLDALQANIDLQHKLGFLKAPLDVKKYADFGIAKEAAQRLAAGQ